MLNSSCLSADWVFTPVVTVISIAIFVWPVKRLHCTASLILSYFFLCYALEFFLLDFAVDSVNKMGHPEWLTLSIPAMAIAGVIALFLLMWIAEWIIVTVAIMMMAQTDLYYISLPIAVVIGFAVWAFLSLSGWANVKHIFTIALFGAANIVIGFAGIFLEVSTAMDNLPYECQKHLNMFLLCDASCSSILVYSSPALRVGLVAAGMFLMLLRIFTICFCCGGCSDEPKLKSNCCFCDVWYTNQDTWVSSDDRRKYDKVEESE